MNSKNQERLQNRKRGSNRWNNATREWKKKRGESKKKRKRISFFLPLISVLVLSVLLLFSISLHFLLLTLPPHRRSFFFSPPSVWNWVGFMFKMECPSTLTLKKDIERDLCMAEKRMEDCFLCDTILVQ